MAARTLTRRPGRRSAHPPLAVTVAVAVAVLALVAGACSDDGDATGADGTTSTSSNAAALATTTTDAVPVGDPVSRYQLVVGDCFNRYPSIDVFTRVPCEGEHDAEVYHYENHPAPFGEPYPNDREMQRYALRVCYAPFEAFAGILYEVSRLDIGAFTPTKENWEDAKARYRGITCYVTDSGGEHLVGSMRGRGE